MKLNYPKSETVAVGLGAVFIVALMLLSLSTPGVNGLQVAHALQQETQGCPAPNGPGSVSDAENYLQSVASTYLGLNSGAQVTSFRADAFSWNGTHFSVSGLHLATTETSTYTIDNTPQQTNASLSLGSLTIDWNASTLSVSISALSYTARIVSTTPQGSDSLPGAPLTTRFGVENPGTVAFAWSCTEAAN